MDCRCPLYLAVVLLGAVGCAPNKSLPNLSSDAVRPPDLVPIAEEPPKEFKPATLVALAALTEEAADMTPTPGERAKRLEEARRAYHKALKSEPKFVPAHVGLARNWEMAEHFERAQSTYDAALKALPKEPTIWYEAGLFRARQKDWDGAVERLRKAAELDHENRQYVNGYALLLARVGRYEESLVWLKKIHNDGEAYYTLARMLHHMQLDDLSRQYVRQALQNSPKLTAAQQLLAELNAPKTTAGTASADKP